MKTLIIAIALLLIASSSHAEMRPGDDMHLIGSTIIGGLTQSYTKNIYKSMLICPAIGAIKEGLDATGSGTPDLKDMSYNIAGCALGAFSVYGIQLYTNGNTVGIQVGGDF